MLQLILSYDEFWENNFVDNDILRKITKTNKLVYRLYLSLIAFGFVTYLSFFVPKVINANNFVFFGIRTESRAISIILTIYSLYILCFTLAFQGIFYGLLLFVYCQSIALKNHAKKLNFEFSTEEEKYKKLIVCVDYYMKIIWWDEILRFCKII